MNRRPRYRTLGPRQNFLALEPSVSGLPASRIVVLPVPYEHTTTYGRGTRRGPQALIDASRNVETYDEELQRELPALAGIATLPPLAFGSRTDRNAVAAIEKTVGPLLDEEKFVVTIGGEHTVSLGPIGAHARRSPDLSVLQLDAHSDLRGTYRGNPYSHACTMARVCDLIDPRRLVQVGVRAQSAEEARTARDRRVGTFYAHDIRAGRYGPSPVDWQRAVLERLTEHVYVTFDVDALDPAVMPSTGTPEPNGLLWAETMALLRRVGETRTIVGCDVVELAPARGVHHADLAAAKLVYKLMNYAFLRERG